MNQQLALPRGEVTVYGMLRQPKYYKPGNTYFLPSPEVTSYNGQLLDSNPRWLWADIESMMNYVKTSLQDTTLADKIDTALSSHFVEEVIDWNSDDPHIVEEMMAWHNDTADLENAQQSMPTILASLKALHSDPRMFHGKPIVGPPSINVPNKHLGYVYTWYSLGVVVALTIYLTSRGKRGAIPKRS